MEVLFVKAMMVTECSKPLRGYGWILLLQEEQPVHWMGMERLLVGGMTEMELPIPPVKVDLAVCMSLDFPLAHYAQIGLLFVGGIMFMEERTFPSALGNRLMPGIIISVAFEKMTQWNAGAVVVMG